MIRNGFHFGTLLVCFLLLNQEHWPQLRQVRLVVLWMFSWFLLRPPGMVHHCFNFSTFVDNDSCCGLLESQSLKNAAVSLCRLKVGCFSSSSLDATKHGVFEIFQPTSLFQTLFKWFIWFNIPDRNQVCVWPMKLNSVFKKSL